MGTGDRVVVKELIPKLRQQLEDVADLIRAHIGSRGDSHVVGNADHPGFMDKALYARLLGFRDNIDELWDLVEKSKLPEGAMLYWPKGENVVPNGFVLCNGNNNTIDMRGKFVMGTKDDSEYAEVTGKDSIPSSEFPVPRHTHYFNNYVYSEIWIDIENYAQNTYQKLTYSDNKLGSHGTVYGDSSTYPASYYDTTTSTNVTNGSAVNTEVDIVPPYRSLAVIKKSTKVAPLSADSVGTIHILLSHSIPEGLLELSGQLVSKTLYNALYKYAVASDLVLSESAWTAYKTAHKSVPYFGESSISGMYRLPLLDEACIAIRSSNDEAVSEEQGLSSHYHAFGSWSNNNGVWPAKAYSDATFPDGTQGVYWNGKGSAGWPSQDTPPTSGHYITSNNFDVGVSGNGKMCSTNNFTIAIRAFHPEAVMVTDDAVNTITTYASMANNAVAAIDENEDALTESWKTNVDGTLSVWGSQTANTDTIVLPRSMKSKILTVNLMNLNSNSEKPSIKSMTPETITVNLGEHSLSDTITYYVTGV